ncbi:14835_t:CDS:1, partial [Acaulospora morrowiae]
VNMTPISQVEVAMSKSEALGRAKRIDQSLQYKLRDKTRLFIDFMRIKVKG